MRQSKSLCGTVWYVCINKWKNHFSEMKGDVGMSPHEKEGEQEDAYTKTRNSFITPSLHLCKKLCFVIE